MMEGDGRTRVAEGHGEKRLILFHCTACACPLVSQAHPAVLSVRAATAETWEMGLLGREKRLQQHLSPPRSMSQVNGLHWESQEGS